MTTSTKASANSPPEEEPSELARFRAEWKAELETRKRVRTGELQAANVGWTTEAGGSKVVPSPEATPKLVVIPISKPKDQGPHTATLGSHPSVTPDGKVVDQKRARNLDSALSVYRRAIQHEQMGDLDEALLLYRQAFRMDSHVDRAFHREEMLANIAAQQVGLEPTATATMDIMIVSAATSHSGERRIDDVTTSLRNLSVKPQTIQTGQAIATGTLGTLVASFLEQEEMLKFKPEDETQPAVLSLLPEELLVEVIRILDPTSIERFARVCKKARVMTLESSIWQGLVTSTYKKPQILDMEILAEVISRYMFDYRRVFIEQPRIRTDGVYIATCHYTRLGLSENHWVNISYLITYHRYLRFYPNGQVLSLLANEEIGPQAIIPMLKPSLRMKGLYIGTWQLSGTTVILSNLFDASGRYPTPGTIEAPPLQQHSHSHGTSSGPQQVRYVFVMSLNLRSKPLGRWNRLDIQSYDTLNLETGDVTPVALKHERPFWFSKVRSYAS